MQTDLTVQCNYFHANTIKITSISEFYFFDIFVYFWRRKLLWSACVYNSLCQHSDPVCNEIRITWANEIL